MPFALAAGFVASAKSQAHVTMDRTAIVNGHRMAYRVHGSGKPVIVLMSGLGDDMSTFEDAASALSKHGTVIVYDRAGYGDSETAKGPRDAKAAASDLHALLAQTGIPGPYVVASHSLGGLYAEYFAASHPELVSGLILEEARPAEFTKRCQRLIDKPMCVPPSWAVWFTGKGAQAELAALEQTISQVEGIPPIEDRPVLILSRSPYSARSSFDVLWADVQNSLQASYPGSTHQFAPDGNHDIHGTHAAWFNSSVESFLREKL